jgi:lysophospholipase L1-like esterase
MKTILCFGDSNTWGYVPGSGRRYDRSQRWPGALQSALGDDYLVIEEGLNARTTVLEDPTKPLGKNGLTYLRPCLDSHAPLDLVILLLGTNDLKHRFALSAFDIAQNIAALVGVVQQSGSGQGGKAPPLLLLSPHIGPLTGLASMFAGAEEKSRQLAQHYRMVATQTGCHFLDVSEVVTASMADGVHWEADQHAALGEHLASKVQKILPATTSASG